MGVDKNENVQRIQKEQSVQIFFSPSVGRFLRIQVPTHTVLQSFHTQILTTLWMWWEGSRFLPVGAWHVEKATLLDLLAPLHAVSNGVTVEHSHIHTDTESYTGLQSTDLLWWLFHAPLSWIDYLSPPVSLLGGGLRRLWQTDETQTARDCGMHERYKRKTDREICPVAKSYTVNYTQRICMLHISFKLFKHSDSCAYTSVTLI